VADFWAALIGAVIGSATTLAAAAIAYKSVVNVERGKAERSAVTDLATAAFDFDKALLSLQEAINAKDKTESDFKLADEHVRVTGRDLNRLSYLVRDDMLARLAQGMYQAGFEERINLIPPAPRADLGRVVRQRDALAARATEVLKGL
jgi:hypothetical protein